MDWGCYHGLDSIKLYSTIQLNLGSLYNRMKFYRLALEHYSKVEMDEYKRALLINNVSSSYIGTGRHVRALDELDKLKDSDWANAEIGGLANLNKLNALLHLGRFDEAKSTYKLLSLDQVSRADTVPHVAVFMHYAIYTNDTLEFLKVMSKFGDFIQRNIDKRKEFAYIQPMMEAYTSDRKRFESMWTVLHEGFSYTPKETTDLHRFPWRFSWSTLNERTRSIYVITSALLALLSLLLGAFLSKRATESRILAQLGARSLKELDLRTPGGSNTQLDDKSQEKLELFIKTLSVTEAKLLAMLRENNSSKEISDELRCSVGHVYNLRSTLRKKFEQYFQETTLDDWLKGKTTLN